MTMLLEQAIDKVRNLSDDDQNAVALALIRLVPDAVPVIDLESDASCRT